MPNHAEDLAKATGASKVTYTQERRNADGSLTVESVETYEQSAPEQAKIVDLLAAHQPLGPMLQRGRGVMTCTCGQQVEIVDDPYCPPELTQVSVDALRHAFAAHQAKILREHANVTEK